MTQIYVQAREMLSPSYTTQWTEIPIASF
ncbi:DUF4113 domain-containing protein [Escherichia coli]